MKNQTKYTQINAQTIDEWVDGGWEWGRPIDHATFERAKQGCWSMLLSPTKPVPKSWFGNLNGADVLGLACGGGQQMPIFAALGARCTVLDYSARQLESEDMVAKREGYTIRIIRADMTEPIPLEDEGFDLIFHPVSTCYVEKVEPIWQECYRLLKPGGILLAGLDNGINYLFNEDETQLIHGLPYNPLKEPELYRESVEKHWGIQFSHTLEEQLGGQLRAGFMLTDVYEDTNGEGRLHEMGIPTFWVTRAVKPQDRP